MRFLADGVDIPDRLLWAHDEGRVVFFCGAGVSMGPNRLPGFVGLTQSVLADLRATAEDEAQLLFERIKAFDGQSELDGLITADRVFQLMEKSFTKPDINRAVAAALKPADDFDLSAHKTLLKLSRLPSGQTRLVTTNFDRLFEKANSKLRSSTRSSLPRIEYENVDWGIVHVHGCVSPNYAGPTSDGFVLSSSEFGNAYLSAGWARDFVSQILSSYVAVFIGYRADDPPIRYLLEGLQIEGGAPNDIFAFQASVNGQEALAWEEKGVVPILYPKSGEHSHNTLWKSLEAWSTRAADPDRWRKRALNFARKEPATLKAHERGIVAHLVTSTGGARAFSRMSPKPPSEWLCVFDQRIRFGEPKPIDGPFTDSKVIDPFSVYNIDSDPPPIEPNDKFAPKQARIPRAVWSALEPTDEDRIGLEDYQIPCLRGHRSSEAARLPLRLSYLANWIANSAKEPACVWWAGRQEHIHKEILDAVPHRFTDATMSSVIKCIWQAWQEIMEYHDMGGVRSNDIYSIHHEIGRSSWHPTTVRNYAEAWTPKLTQSMWQLSSIPPNKASRKRLVSYEPQYIQVANSPLEVPDAYLKPLLRHLSIALEKVCDLENRYSGGDQAFCSIEQDDDREGYDADRNHSLSGHVLHFVSLFRRLADIDPSAAFDLIQLWPDKDLLFRRLKIWGLGNLSIAPATEFASLLYGISKEDFWPFHGNRDLLLGLARRWADLSDAERLKLERRIKHGPPRRGHLSTEENRKYSAHQRLRRLIWMHEQGCTFSFDIHRYKATLLADCPGWKDEWAESAAESHDGRSGMVKTEADWAALRNTPIERILEEVAKHEKGGDGFLTDYRPFVGLSDDVPLRALAALNHARKIGESASKYWSSFLGREARRDDSIRFKVLIAGRLSQLSDDDFDAISNTASRWYRDNGADVNAGSAIIFERLWSAFLNILRIEGRAAMSSLVRSGDRIDWSSEAINSTAGHLAELLMNHPPLATMQTSDEFDPGWLNKVEQLLNLPGDPARYALVTYCFRVGWFHAHAAEWTEQNLLSPLNADPSSPNYQACIAALMRNPIPSANLFVFLKPHLLKMVSQTQFTENQHVQTLSGFLLAGWHSINDDGHRYVSNEQLEEALLYSSEAFRRALLWHLKRWSEGDEWQGAVHDILKSAWPRHKKIRTPAISARLFEIAISETKYFKEVAEIVAGLAVPLTDVNFYCPSLRDYENSSALAHPSALLDLLHAVLPRDRPIGLHDTEAWLKAIVERDPSLRNNAKYRELMIKFGRD